MTKHVKSHAQNNSHLKDLSVAKAILKLIPSYTLDEDDILLCEQYHIPYQKSYSSYRELYATEELITEYLELLDEAKKLGINWNTATFDLEGLKEAVEDRHIREGEEESEYYSEQRSNRWAYYSSVGVV